MEKEEYIELRKSIRKEILHYIELQDAHRKEKEFVLRSVISDLRVEVKSLREELLSHLYASRDRENLLIFELDNKC